MTQKDGESVLSERHPKARMRHGATSMIAITSQRQRDGRRACRVWSNAMEIWLWFDIPGACKVFIFLVTFSRHEIALILQVRAGINAGSMYFFYSMDALLPGWGCMHPHTM
ncbi:hypothetical protein PV04_07361 [Phialophora macrospora]|uniref:Uncharacterized protein n=1 Tax=Phialophora macrospora TaxID=1851006 RepID=A0A0D2DSD8_9EURO|nr:hypothetical protein PV04_07361 [Phialophora macrospora]